MAYKINECAVGLASAADNINYKRTIIFRRELNVFLRIHFRLYPDELNVWLSIDLNRIIVRYRADVAQKGVYLLQTKPILVNIQFNAKSFVHLLLLLTCRYFFSDYKSKIFLSNKALHIMANFQ